MNELAVKTSFLRTLTDDESRALKRLLLEMYCDIAKLCDTYHLKYMLGGGSCLGAVRHKGFIPWDDDLDIMMPRDSYDQFIAHCEKGELGDTYEFSYPQREKDSRNPFLKVFKKGTLDVELQNDNTPFPKGVYIDVFPMESAPKTKIIRKLKGYISDTLRIICTSVLYAQYPSKKYKDFMSLDSIAFRRYKNRMLIGRLFGIVSHKRWVWLFDRFNHSTKITGYITIPTGRKGYFGESLPSSIFFPTREALFEGITVNIPNDSDLYLTSLYRDYMVIPPIEHRERHQVYLFRI